MITDKQFHEVVERAYLIADKVMQAMASTHVIGETWFLTEPVTFFTRGMGGPLEVNIPRVELFSARSVAEVANDIVARILAKEEREEELAEKRRLELG